MDYTQPTKNIFFPDQEEPIYDPSDSISEYQFHEYWNRERQRCMDGFELADGKVKISGWLYWHCVYWKIAMYVTQPNKRKHRVIATPLLRDIEWDIGGDFSKCEELGRFYALVGSRDFGKSVIAASRAGWLYTFFNKSESVISGGEASYIKLVTDKIEDGLMNTHPIFKKNRLLTDWKKEVRAGWKDKKSNQPSRQSSMSAILMRNYEMGNKTMAANGTRPGFHLIDEIGTLPNLISCVRDSDGCWWSGTGNKPSCLVMLAGTGGDMERGKDASEIFNNPEGYNILEFDNTWEGIGKIGRFIPATRAKMEYMEPSNLASYLGIDHPDLQKITILVANQERCLKEYWEPGFAKAKKAGTTSVLKFKASWPLKPADAFLVLSTNNFNTEGARAQQIRLGNNTGTPIELYHDGENIKHKFTDKLPITQFPVRDQSKDAPIVIYEFPDENPPFGLYVAGVDPYKQGKASYSDSLGAVYIFKRMHDIQGERYQDMLVASYVSRPDRKEDWEEQARLLIKYFNARTLCENDEYSFIEMMKAKGDARYLERQPDWIREIVPHTQVTREYGIHRSADRIRIHLHDCLKKYMDQVVYVEKDAEGSIIKEHLGVTRILDPMLLEEIIRWNDEDNFDRVVAAELAIALARHLDPIIGRASEWERDSRYKSYQNINKSTANKLFGMSDSRPFYTRKGSKSKLFI